MVPITTGDVGAPPALPSGSCAVGPESQRQRGSRAALGSWRCNSHRPDRLLSPFPVGLIRPRSPCRKISAPRSFLPPCAGVELFLEWTGALPGQQTESFVVSEDGNTLLRTVEMTLKSGGRYSGRTIYRRSS